MNYSIKRNGWNGKMEIFENNVSIGIVENLGFWSTNAKAIFYGEKYKFISRGFFSIVIEIYKEDNHHIGTIRIPNMSKRVEVSLYGKEYIWMKTNFWATRWKLVDEHLKELHIINNTFSGNMNMENDNKILYLLSTFLLFDVYRRRAAAVAV